jgi:hypothetical protein
LFDGLEEEGICLRRGDYRRSNLSRTNRLNGSVGHEFVPKLLVTTTVAENCLDLTRYELVESGDVDCLYCGFAKSL